MRISLTAVLRLFLTLFTAALFTTTLGSHTLFAQTSSVNSVFVIVGARIEVGDGSVIEKGTILLRDGIIEAVGSDVKVPLEAEIIKGDGLTVYPGFIDAHTTKGITLPDAVSAQDIVPDTTAAPQVSMREANRKGIRPELRACDCLALTDDLLRTARSAGFTTQMITPGAGIMGGVGSLVNLNGLPRRYAVLRPEVASSFAFRQGGGGFGAGGGAPRDRGYPGSLMGVMAFTRQTLLDAQYYTALELAFQRGSSQRPPADETLRALQPVINGKMPVLYDADTEIEIRRALKMADEFHLNLILSGATEAYKVAPILANKKIPVLVSLNFGQEPGVAATPMGGGIGAGGFGNRPGSFGNRPGGRRQGLPGQPGTPPNAPPTGTPTGVPAVDAQPPANPQVRPAQPPITPTPQSAPQPDENSDLPKVVIAERHKIWEEKVANAATLSKAGVPFAFSTQGVRSQTEFLTNLRRAIRSGLPREVALKALTIDAAKLLGVDKQLGTITPGKTAAIVVMTGDFVAPTSRVKYLFIDRNRFEPDRDTGPLPTLPVRNFPGEEDHE